LSNTFGSVFILSSTHAPTVVSKYSSQCEINVNIFSPEGILKYIERLDPRKSTEMYHIHPFVVKSCAVAFSEALSVIFSRSFISSRIPDAWRLAQISPIFKKGSRSSPDNYRPISLTSVPCKLMKRIVRDVMMEHLYSNNAIAPE